MATTAAATAQKPALSALKTPLSATYPSELRSPLVASPTMFKREEGGYTHGGQKTPITPPSAYVDFLKALSPVLVSPLATGASTKFAFPERTSSSSSIATVATLSSTTSAASSASSCGSVDRTSTTAAAATDRKIKHEDADGDEPGLAQKKPVDSPIDPALTDETISARSSRASSTIGSQPTSTHSEPPNRCTCAANPTTPSSPPATSTQKKNSATQTATSHKRPASIAIPPAAPFMHHHSHHGHHGHHHQHPHSARTPRHPLSARTPRLHIPASPYSAGIKVAPSPMSATARSATFPVSPWSPRHGEASTPVSATTRMSVREVVTRTVRYSRGPGTGTGNGSAGQGPGQGQGQGSGPGQGQGQGEGQGQGPTTGEAPSETTMTKTTTVEIGDVPREKRRRVE